MDKKSIILELYSILVSSNVADKVYKDYISEGDIPSTVKKAIMITDIEPEDSIDYTTSGYADVVFTITLLCQVNFISDIFSEMNEFDREIKAVIGNNSKLNGKAFSVQITPSSGKEVLGNLGRFDRPIQIQYEGVVTDGL